MIIYSGSKTDFMTEVENDTIAYSIRNNILEKMHRKTGEAEFRSWVNSLEYMYKVLNDDGIPVVKNVDADHQDMAYNSMQNIDYTLLVNGQWLDTDEKTMKAQALSYQGYAEEYAAMYEVGNQDLIPQSFTIRSSLPSEAQYNTTLKDFHREILVRCAMCKPEEVHDLFQQLKQEYLNRGGQAVMDERTAAWDLEHPAN